MASHRKPTDTSIPLQPPTILLFHFGWSKNYLQLHFTARWKQLLTSSSQPDFLFALFVFIIDVNIPTWEDCCVTVSVFHYLLSYWCPLFPCSLLHIAVMLQHLANCWIGQKEMLDIPVCWTIEICTDIGISKPIQPDTLTNKTYPLYSMSWKCFTLLYITDTSINVNIHKMKVLFVCSRTVVKLETWQVSLLCKAHKGFLRRIFNLSMYFNLIYLQ